MPQFDGLLVVAAISFGVPFLLGLHRRVLLPPVVLEIVAGIVIGPSVLAVTDIDPTIEVVSVLASRSCSSSPAWRSTRARFAGRSCASLSSDSRCHSRWPQPRPRS